MKANIYRRFPLELQRYRKHFGPLLCPCPRWISILWFFLGGTGWRISPKWQELPTCAIYFSPWPSGLLRPGKTSGEKIISNCLYKIDNDNLNCFRKWKFWPSQTRVLYIHMISNILWYHALTDWDTGYLQKSFFQDTLKYSRKQKFWQSPAFSMNIWIFRK